VLRATGLAELGLLHHPRLRLWALVSSVDTVSPDLFMVAWEAILPSPDLDIRLVCTGGNDDVLLALYELGADIKVLPGVRDALVIVDDTVVTDSERGVAATRDPDRLATALATFERVRSLARPWEPDHLLPSRRVVRRLAWLPPSESAVFRLTHGQAIFLIALLGAVLAAVALQPLAFLLALGAVGVVFYSVNLIYKLLLIVPAMVKTVEVNVTGAELAGLSYEQLPVYTVLVPLYREAEVAADLVEALVQMDYPKEKMDVQFLVERDDRATLDYLRRLSLPPSFRIQLIPDLYPRTKPKACQFGLLKARGRYLVIYDAEDRPDPDQMKVAVAAFRKMGPEVACLQAKLNYYNKRWNLLSRFFTIEYSTWFDLFLPGLMLQGAPIPLGGTSNHFRTDALREVGGWDPFNVTEDCDLGIRLHRRGYRTRIIASTTWEEANVELRNWLRQRSRWIKGYMHTYLVHTRGLRVFRQLSWWDLVGFHVMVFGTFFAPLINPVFWGIFLLWLLTRWDLLALLFPGPVYTLAVASLVLGNGFFILTGIIGVVRRGFTDLLPYTLLMPLYWALMSVAAYKALMQLIYRPHYWEKTRHGLATPASAGYQPPNAS
jgi:cellulose synthase/poly-beta-1,6-N-acetylglucosamine synthase-like glycosyltransferase